MTSRIPASLAALVISTGCGASVGSLPSQSASPRIPVPQFTGAVASPTATPSSVSVRGAAGEAIAFGDGAGNLLGQGVVGADGTASVAVPDGGSVTVASSDGAGSFRLQTILGVANGMHAAFVDASPVQAPGAQLHVRFATDAPGATGYDFQTGCGAVSQGNAGADSWITLDPACNPDDVTLLVIGRDDSNAAVGASWVEHVSVPPSGTTDVWVGDWSAGVGSTTVEIGAVPGGSWASGSVRIWKNGSPYTTDGAISGPAEIGFAAPVVFPRGADQATVELDVWYADGASGATLQRGVDTSGPEVAIDLSSELLPQITGAAIQPDPAGTPALTWATADGTTAPVAVVTAMQWTDAGQNNWEWDALSAANGNTLKMPAMPSEFAGARGSVAWNGGTVMLVQADGHSFGDYAAADEWTVTGSTVRTSWRFAAIPQD